MNEEMLTFRRRFHFLGREDTKLRVPLFFPALLYRFVLHLQRKVAIQKAGVECEKHGDGV